MVWRRTLIVTISMLMLLLLPAMALAQTYYYRWQTGVVTFTCATVVGGVNVTFSSQPVEYNLPAGATITITYVTNGAAIVTGPFPAPFTGTGTFIYGPLASNIVPAYPLTYEVILQTIIGSSVVYTSSMSANCTADGSGPAIVTNPGSGSGTGPSFTDGRLNPEPGAPVAIYCNSGGVTVLRINPTTGRGENALEVSAPQINAGLGQAIASGRNVLVGGDSVVGLYALSSNELQVQANISGQYNFIFAASRCGFQASAGGSVATPVGGSPTGGTTYIVQRGDTLFRIAQRFGTTVSAIASANGITNATLIYPGQRLIIPGASGTPIVIPTTAPGNPPRATATPVSGTSSGGTHVVQRGETLFRIALRYGVTVQALQQANNIQNPNLIFAGQVLIIP